MYLEYTPEHRELSRELRAYFARLLTPEVREALGGHQRGPSGLPRDHPSDRQGRPARARLAQGVRRPGPPGVDQYILFDEINRAQVPFPFVTINNVGPMLMRYGTEEQKRSYLPGMLAGDVHFAIGYSEPGAGTDSPRSRTKAEATATGGSSTARRSSPAAPARPTSSGWPCAPTRRPEAQGHHHPHRADVGPRLQLHADRHQRHHPHQRLLLRGRARGREALVGEVNGGWRLITGQLGHERVGLAAMGGRTEQLWTDIAAWAAEPDADGIRVLDKPGCARSWPVTTPS